MPIYVLGQNLGPLPLADHANMKIKLESFLETYTKTKSVPQALNIFEPGGPLSKTILVKL